jgi:hypothetical protein
MSAATTFPSTTSTQNVHLLSQLTSIPLNAGACALAGRLFGIISPAGGAIYGASATTASIITGLLMPTSDETTTVATKIAKFAVQGFTATATAIAVTTALGYPMTALAAVKLNIASGLIVGIGAIALAAIFGIGLCCARASGRCNL